MPKVKWAGDLDTDAIESVERSNQDYTGDIPPNGVYRFKLRFSKKDVSSEGNPKLVNLLILDGSWKPEHKKYDGCPLWEHMAVTKKTAFRVRRYCDALNISAADFMGRMIIDDEGYVQKIGKLTIADEDRLILARVVCEKSDEYGDRLGFGKNGGYLPFDDGEDDDDDDDAESGDDAGEDAGEDPF